MITPHMESVAAKMKAHAETGYFDGAPHNMYLPYFYHARRVDIQTGTVLIYTRDVGYHTSGFFKNPDYERCYHLSLSFIDPKEKKCRPFDPSLAEAWVRCFFGEWVRYIWEESGNKDKVDDPEVQHYRVFCDPGWQPIIPRKEVYTLEFTEAGWLSWSDARYAEAQERKRRK